MRKTPIDLNVSTRSSGMRRAASISAAREAMLAPIPGYRRANVGLFDSSLNCTALSLPLSFNVCEGGYSCSCRKRGRKLSHVAMFEKHTHEASDPSQGKGRPQIAVGFKSELPFEIARAEPRGSEVIRRKDTSEGAAIGITERPLLAQSGRSARR
jgi:hypothetical protein